MQQSTRGGSNIIHSGIHRNGRHSHGMRRWFCPNEVHRGSGWRLCRQGHRGRSVVYRKISPQGDSASCCVRDPYQNCGCEARSRDHRPSGRDDYIELLLGRMNGGSCCQSRRRRYGVIVGCGRSCRTE